MISFTIPGEPKALKRHRHTRKGVTYDPSKRDKKELWLQIARFKPKTPFKGEIYLRVAFYFKRPNHHFKIKKGKPSNIIKDKYAHIKYKSSRPDIDNLIKMIADVIQPQMIHEDDQICMLQAEKLYGKPRTEVIIQEI